MIEPTHFTEPERIRISRTRENRAIISALLARVETLAAHVTSHENRIQSLELANAATCSSGPLSPTTQEKIA